MSFTNVSVLEQIRARVAKTLTAGVQLNMSTDESKKLLKRHVNKKTNVVIVFIDVNNSTEMSLSLPEDRFALMIQIFAQEISIAVTGYGGYVFKYEGDAVIGLFPGEYDRAKACKNALNCTTSILEIIREVINPAFKENSLPEISVRIGLTYGYALVVLYGNSLEKAYIDIIGSSISLASKIVSIAKPNQVLVGESIYNILLSSESISDNEFIEINLDPTKWKYLSRSDPESMYRVYEYHS
ncbi:MAG TPA: adenylate/guanylate cyclase domain-containing protein [Candidatus Nitrosopolaris rasttigaisensis]|jgi:class 3 adenylate cyclase|nr:adenylate/guanylate cyclase domain-containing protein [Candidatus Nitrosopolaris rasttigaisensis]